jgi:hypothetical protein
LKNGSRRNELWNEDDALCDGGIQYLLFRKFILSLKKEKKMGFID